MSDEELIARLIWPHDMNGRTPTDAPERIAAALAGRLLPAGGAESIEWGVWWHIDSADGICMSAYGLNGREQAERVGRSKIGVHGVRGFTCVRRTVTRYEAGDFLTRFERDGEAIWLGEQP